MQVICCSWKALNAYSIPWSCTPVKFVTHKRSFYSQTFWFWFSNYLFPSKKKKKKRRLTSLCSAITRPSIHKQLVLSYSLSTYSLPPCCCFLRWFAAGWRVTLSCFTDHQAEKHCARGYTKGAESRACFRSQFEFSRHKSLKNLVYSPFSSVHLYMTHYWQNTVMH